MTPNPNERERSRRDMPPELIAWLGWTEEDVRWCEAHPNALEEIIRELEAESGTGEA